MSLEENIKKWVALDNQLKTLSDKTKELREARSTTEELILEYVETKKMNNATVNISAANNKSYLYACIYSCFDIIGVLLQNFRIQSEGIVSH